ncbi:ABC transporter ATP-binding protein [Actinocrispum wychmicini]|uniref:Putative ABC transport system ATP-binding protein n=1 Tax=Actinocrispum wychmicini TaxID=1213861 RepID=A0A4R2J918_9PSEU|nr:ABC transporter ATP-binding protein [Actinocrispum wychmicini]TCO53126.1 putative ABC transport system ATP-binding protein [Actinocrispum wychmicini]
MKTSTAASASNLSKTYGEGVTQVVALDSVAIRIATGTFTAIMGPSGSGKSTLMHCLAGLDTPTSGQAWIGDTEITGLPDDKLTLLRRERVGFVFQAFNLVPTLSVLENITLPLDIAGAAVDRSWVDEVITTVGLADRLAHRPAELSGGQRQRVACARALATRPAIIFADEPTGNLDSRSGTDILRLLRRGVDTLDQTIVMVTHDPVAASYADRVLMLADGRIVHEIADPTPGLVHDVLKRLDRAGTPC